MVSEGSLGGVGFSLRRFSRYWGLEAEKGRSSKPILQQYPLSYIYIYQGVHSTRVYSTRVYIVLEYTVLEYIVLEYTVPECI